MEITLNKKRNAALDIFSHSLGISVQNVAYLHQALTHTSYANENRSSGSLDNERLEFLGDAILDLVISEFLFHSFPNYPEGELTKARAAIVCEETLAKRAAELQIGAYMLLGKGEATSGGRERVSILADAFEAVIGSIYLDGGFESAKKFILRQLQSELQLVKRGEYTKDYKTLLQEIIQRNSEDKIIYEIVGEKGPDHDKTFEVIARVKSQLLGTGSGKSKKEAEQFAAKQALLQINIRKND